MKPHKPKSPEARMSDHLNLKGKDKLSSRMLMVMISIDWRRRGPYISAETIKESFDKRTIKALEKRGLIKKKGDQYTCGWYNNTPSHLRADYHKELRALKRQNS